MQNNDSNHSLSRRRSPRRRGVALLEAALVLPMLLVLIFGSIDLGYAFFVKHTLQGASREGARRAAVADSNAEVQAAVDEALKGAGLKNIRRTVQILRTSNGSATNVATIGEGNSITVEVKADWSQFSAFITPITGIHLGQISGRCVMRRER